jgi:K+-transporting ATPase c subunit
MWQQLGTGFKMMLVLTVLTGLLYPGVVTGLCQVLFRGRQRRLRSDGFGCI